MSFLSSLFGTSTGNSNLTKLIEEGAFLVDVRSPQEFESGSVKGAVNIPVDFILKNISKFKDKKHIIVFCRSGTRSGMAKSVLEQNGIKNVTNGGTWQDVAACVK